MSRRKITTDRVLSVYVPNRCNEVGGVEDFRRDNEVTRRGPDIRPERSTGYVATVRVRAVTNRSLGKLMDAVLQPTKTKLDSCIATVESEVKKMKSLKNVAHEAQTADIKNMVENTESGTTCRRFYSSISFANTLII